MKQVYIALLGVACAHKLNSYGIDKEEIMQNQASHWRKQWPQGAIDNADGDSEVMDMFAQPEKKTKEHVKETYPWTLADEAITTAESLKTAEGKLGKKLSAESVKDGGMGMIFTYDNTKRVFERNTPQGNTWYDASKLSNE